MAACRGPSWDWDDLRESAFHSWCCSRPALDEEQPRLWTVKARPRPPPRNCRLTQLVESSLAPITALHIQRIMQLLGGPPSSFCCVPCTSRLPQEAILGDWRLASLSANEACSTLDSWFLSFTSQPDACLGWDELRQLSQQLQQAARSLQPDQTGQPEGPCASAWDSLRTDDSAGLASSLVSTVDFLVKPRGGARRLRRLEVHTTWWAGGPVPFKAFTDDGGGWMELCTRSAVSNQPLELPLDVQVLPQVRSRILTGVHGRTFVPAAHALSYVRRHVQGMRLRLAVEPPGMFMAGKALVLPVGGTDESGRLGALALGEDGLVPVVHMHSVGTDGVAALVHQSSVPPWALEVR